MRFTIQLRGGPKDGLGFVVTTRPGYREDVKMVVGNEPLSIALYRRSDTVLLSGPLGDAGGPPDIVGAVYDFAGYERIGERTP